jgi:hypothetical protein
MTATTAISNLPDLQAVVLALTDPQRVFSRSEMLAKPCPVPKERGVYAWFFKEVPSGVPVADCLQHDQLKLLYVGISPHKAFKPTTKQSLHRRIRYHYAGNAYGSTLRLTLGTSLAEQSRLPPRRVGSGERITLTHAGEQWLDKWMHENAFVVWLPHQEPWLLEDYLISTVSCPLNIADSAHHSFNPTLKARRKEALAKARELPIASESASRRKACCLAGAATDVSRAAIDEST